MTEPSAPEMIAAAPASTPVLLAPHPASRWPLAVVSVVAVVAIVLAIVAGWIAADGRSRLRGLEQELVRRQDDTQGEASEAKALSKAAQDSARESAAKLALLEARVAEVAVQRSQLEDLIQSLSRSRDENIVVDIDAALRLAQRQSLITGSAEPLVAALKQADERLGRYNQPRLDGVRRAIARDLDRVKAAGLTDIGALTIKLDEAVRLVDDMPLLSSPELASHEAAAKADAAASSPAPAAPASASWMSRWLQGMGAWTDFGSRVWGEVRSLVRVTRIDHPEGMLLAPEQGFFLRENLKLRLLNARLALLGRQFETAQTDLQVAMSAIDRYFERNSRKVLSVNELLQQVAAQARNVSVPRPDDSLAALTTAAAGR